MAKYLKSIMCLSHLLIHITLKHHFWSMKSKDNRTVFEINYSIKCAFINPQLSCSLFKPPNYAKDMTLQCVEISKFMICMFMKILKLHLLPFLKDIMG